MFIVILIKLRSLCSKGLVQILKDGEELFGNL